MKTEKIRVLIVEDCENDAILLLRELNQGKYEIEHLVVTTAPEFEKALLDDWDIIISDYSLPEFTGREALKICIDRKLDTPFIMISGTVGEDIAVEMMQLGARDYLMKNKLSRLLPAIDRELTDAQSRIESLQIKSELKKSENLYQLLFSQAQEGLLVLNKKGEIMDVNQAFAKMHGYSVEEILQIGIHALHLHKNDPLHEHESLFQTGNTSETTRHEITHQHKLGHKIILSISVSKFNTESPLYFVFFQDITKQKEDENALKKKMDQLEWFNKMTVGRELKMIELKEEINGLLKKMGLEEKYVIHKAI